METEIQTLERVLNSGFQWNEPSTKELLVLAKFYRQAGYGQKRITDNILEFCEKHLTYFNKYGNIQRIRSMARKAIRRPEFQDTNDAKIYQEELDAISENKNFKFQQILFSMLVFSKCLGNKHNLSGSLMTEFLLSSGTRIYKNEFRANYKEFWNYIDQYPYRDNRRKTILTRYVLKFASERDDDDYALLVEPTKINMCGEVYKDFIGADWICVDCGKLIVRENNRQKRCNDCQKKIRKEKVREYKKRFNNKNR